MKPSLFALSGIGLIMAILLFAIGFDIGLEWSEVEAGNGDPFVLSEGEYLYDGETHYYNGTLEPAMREDISGVAMVFYIFSGIIFIISTVFLITSLIPDIFFDS